jgi:hypothetical protein
MSLVLGLHCVGFASILLFRCLVQHQLHLNVWAVYLDSNEFLAKTARIDFQVEKALKISTINTIFLPRYPDIYLGCTII